MRRYINRERDVQSVRGKQKNFEINKHIQGFNGVSLSMSGHYINHEFLFPYFPDTVFENEGGSKKDSSVDPFGLYHLLNKKTKDKKHKESDKKPNNDNDDTGDKKSVNDFEEEKLKENVDESASFGRFKKSVAPSSGGSFMCLMEEVVKVGQTMGYNMDGVINNLSDIIESQGASIVDR
ncbi:hypothetical protein Tco_0911878 [Tanacetum coccineum]